MVRLNRITNIFGIERCGSIPAAARVFVLAFLLCLGTAHGWAKQNDQKQQQDQQKSDGQQSANENGSSTMLVKLP